MKSLGRSISRNINNIHPPKNQAEFEDICLDLFEAILKTHKIGIHNKIATHYITYQGTAGDKQYGFDIKCKTSLAVAQCKLVQTLQPSDLDIELGRLLEAPNEVSHYFFLISNDRVKLSLQKWIDVKNNETSTCFTDSHSFPEKPSIRLPWFHILGWSEIKNFILESTFHSLKWGVLSGFDNLYPYLQGLDIESIKTAISNIESGKTPSAQPSATAVSGGLSLLGSIDIKALRHIGTHNKIHQNTLEEVVKFVTLFEEAKDIASSYSYALKNLDSEDNIIFDKGLAQLNQISFFSARILAIQYLTNQYNTANALLDLLYHEDYFENESDTDIDEQGRQFEYYTGYHYYNFHDKDQSGTPWYTNPITASKLANRLAASITNFLPREI